MLFNKDGSVYRLQGPNPAMKEQKLWSDFVTHNMEWQEEISKDNTVLNPVDSDFFIKESFLDALEAAKKALETSKEDIKVTEIEITSQKPEIRTSVVRHDPENDIVSKKEAIDKTFIYCLPASIREKKDSLYGDVYHTVKYGDPTSFEGVVVSQSDFEFEIWTDIASINQGSVLYPKTGFKRWWRVQEKVQKGNGWILKSIPSDYQPSFF